MPLFMSHSYSALPSELRSIPGPVPRNGLLSGMLITAFTAWVVVTFCIFHPSAMVLFGKMPTPALMHAFLASIILMALHKTESFSKAEFDHCPVYLTSGQAPWAQNCRKAIFVSFVTTFIGMLVLVYLVLLGPPWPIALLAVWLGQGLHEFHHLAKSWVRRSFYPGVFSSIAFVLVQSFWVFPQWFKLVFPKGGPLSASLGETVFIAYYVSLPLVLLAFILEDQSWTSTARTVAAPVLNPLR